MEINFCSLTQSESLHPLGTDFPRCGENLSLPGEAFMRKIDFRINRPLPIAFRLILCYTAFCCVFCAASFQSNLGF